MTAPGTVAVSTLGCRLNQVESQEILAIFESRGFRTAAPDERPQVHVVNTCTVTGRADFSDRQTIRRIARDNPGALLVVTGCYAQTDAEAMARIPGVDLGRRQRGEVPAADLLDDLDKRRRPEIRVGDVRAERGVPVAPLTRVSGRSRAFVKIQDGCQHRCAFCIVPTARGGSRSQDPTVVVDQVETLVGRGLSRDHADRRRHRPLRPRPGAAHESRRADRAARRGAGPPLAAAVVDPARVLDRGADRGGHRHARGGTAPAPAASERQRPRAAPHAPSVQSADVPRARGAAGGSDARPRPRHRPHRGTSRRGGRRLRGDACAWSRSCRCRTSTCFRIPTGRGPRRRAGAVTWRRR